jgi:hypothetical protein
MYLIKQLITCHSYTDVSHVPTAECTAIALSTGTIKGWDHVLYSLAHSCSLWADITTKKIQTHKHTILTTNFKIKTSSTHFIKSTVTTLM